MERFENARRTRLVLATRSAFSLEKSLQPRSATERFFFALDPSHAKLLRRRIQIAE
jgi:hypothetical protein